MLMRLIPAALTLCLTLTACGGDNGDSQAAGAFDPAAAAQALMDSGAFTETLEAVDADVAAALYGVDAADITDCAVYTSLSAGAEEIAAVLIQNGAEKPVTLKLPGMTREERDIVLAGCLINYYAK